MTSGQGGLQSSLDIPLSPHLGKQQFDVAYVRTYGLKLLSDGDKLCILCAYKRCREEKHKAGGWVAWVKWCLHHISPGKILVTMTNS